MRQLIINKQITNREDQSLEKYLKEIGKVALLTAEEEVELTKKIKQGDHIALEKMTKANLRFVISVAKQYQNQGLSLCDLINDGNLGLIKAARRFDHTKGFKFISYAVWWIRQSILQALAEQSRIVRLPFNRIGALIRISRTFCELEQKYEREPTAEELSEAMAITLSEVNDSMMLGNRHISFDAPFIQGENKSLLDILECSHNDKPDSELLSDSLKMEIQRILATLTQQESEVIAFYFGLGGHQALSLEEIAEKFLTTSQRVKKIKDKAIIRLRHNFCGKTLRPFLE
jgi:RNA polymerase primary sigma factor